MRYAAWRRVPAAQPEVELGTSWGDRPTYLVRGRGFVLYRAPHATAIDPVTGEVLPDGVEGELVLTTLSKQAMPMIRYRTRDVTKLKSERCGCGLRAPRITRLRGRRDELTGEAIRLHVLDTQYDNMYLLPCGPTPPNPADLLSTPRFEAILREATQQFDRVIIDGPPVLGLADATLLATVVGSVVMIVESGKTKTRSARDALERLRLGGAHVVGAILTKATGDASTYGYRQYQYGAIEQRSDELILISHQADAG